MCDFSLQHIASRNARRGDRLVSTEFGNAAMRGFAAIEDPGVAVCVQSGTELVFDRDIECDHPLAPFPVTRITGRLARYCRINPHDPYEHHDALEFPNGRIVLLARLCPGQRARVLQLPVPLAGPAQNAMQAVAGSRRR
jgi:hypothetical protein